MDEKSTAGLKQQRDRRKRIQRMKKGIVFSLVSWIIISIILFVVLIGRVISLQRQINELKQHIVISDTVAYREAANADELLQGVQPSAGDTETPVTVAHAEDNLAQDTDVHKVYLTFEDGPSSNTEKILDILAEYQVKATFFVVGKEDEASQAVYRRIVEEGHTLAMHSYSHKYSTIYNSLEDFETDTKKLQDYLYEITGVTCKFYRFPGGSANQVSNVDVKEFISYLNGQGIVYYDWNVSSGDAASQAYTADELVENVMADVPKYKTSVVLMHDSDARNTTVDALSSMIEALQAEGAELLPITDDTTVIQYIDAESIQ
ncbi:MAG: polysaccharide deacetylase [Lachnospiraceae bacterium]|nr:polysaccharide deacetylase [Lachnospiraceae bacterium]